jgi:hypothetical protein
MIKNFVYFSEGATIGASLGLGAINVVLPVSPRET